MVKRIAKYGFKSGVLPKPRKLVEPFKTSAELELLKTQPGGFKDPELIPKGAAAHPTPKERIPVEEIIASTVRERKPENANKGSEWKRLNAQIRRKYYIDAMRAQENTELKVLEKREQKLKELQEARSKPEAGVSEATRLTLPTIDSFFKGPFVIPRTPEQTQLLRLKREANRKTLIMKSKQAKAKGLLELYQQSQDYILTEQQLEDTIKKEFAMARNSQATGQLDFNGRLSLSGRLAGGVGAIFDEFQTARETSNEEEVSKITQELVGTTSNGMPGLAEVEDALNGQTHLWNQFIKEQKSKSAEPSN